MPKFEYNRYSKEDVQREAKRSSGRYDSYLTEDVTWFRPKAGENQIRLLPWLNGADKDFKAYKEKWGSYWNIAIIVHNRVGPDNGTYLCLDKMQGQPCPICDAWREDNIDALRPNDRMLCWLIDRNEERVGPKLWAMPLGVSKDISIVSEDKKTKKLLYISDWEDGYDVFFDKEGEKDRTQYKRIALDRDPTRLGKDDDQEEDWLEYVFEKRLPDLLKYYEPDYLEKILTGQKERGDEDKGEERDRSSRRGRDDRGIDGDREEASSRGRSEEDDRDTGSRRRRGGDDAGDREERTSRGRSSEDEGSERPSRRGRGGDEANGRDKEAESAQEEREAQSSRRERSSGRDEDGSTGRRGGTTREKLNEVGRRR